MSWAFSTDELAGLQAAQEAHHMDTCTIDVYTDAGADAFGNPNPSWVAGSALACGFQPSVPDEELDASHVPVFDAKLRLPIGTTVNPQNRITITKRHGVTLSPSRTFEIVGEPKRGPSGLVVELKAVTDGS